MNEIRISNKVKKNLLFVIFTFVLLELFLGGTGRLIEINSFLTLRMFLFGIYMILTVIYLIKNSKLPLQIMIIIFFFISIIIVDSLIGFINGAKSSDIFEDVKPLLNIFLLCYLAFAIKTIDDIRYVLNLIKLSSVLLVILHLILYGLFLVFKDIAVYYSALSFNSEDVNNVNFFFKGESGFVNYTADLYLCVGFIAWEQYHANSWKKYLILVFIAVSIILTGTRGLIFALGAVYLIKWLILKFNYKSLLYIIAGALLILMSYSQINGNIGDKDDSDQIRFDTIKQVIDSVNPISFFIGHGFGIGVPIRPIHMEISYLEVFHKQGIIGLFYYLLIILISYFSYKQSMLENSIGFYMFILFVYFLSFTNPYVNHPLGITIISIAIVCMIKLGSIKNQNERFLI